MSTKPESDGASTPVLAMASLLIALSVALPLVGGLGEAAHMVSPLTDGALLFGFLSPLPIIAVRLGEVRHSLTHAGSADFWLALEAVISAPVFALLGLTLIRKGPQGLWNRVLSCLALLVVIVIMGFSFLGMIGVLL